MHHKGPEIMKASQMMTLNELRQHGYMTVMIGYIIELFDTIIMIYLFPLLSVTLYPSVVGGLRFA